MQTESRNDELSVKCNEFIIQKPVEDGHAKEHDAISRQKRELRILLLRDPLFSQNSLSQEPPQTVFQPLRIHVTRFSYPWCCVELRY